MLIHDNHFSKKHLLNISHFQHLKQHTTKLNLNILHSQFKMHFAVLVKFNSKCEIYSKLNEVAANQEAPIISNYILIFWEEFVNSSPFLLKYRASSSSILKYTGIRNTASYIGQIKLPSKSCIKYTLISMRIHARLLT